MKKRVRIYIEAELWDNVKDRAWRGRVSASEYISGLLVGDIAPEGKPKEVFKEFEPVKEFNLAEVQKRLDAEKASRNIKEEKIKLVRERVKESGGFFNPQPKNKYKKGVN